MKNNKYLIQLLDGSVVRNRGGIKNTLERYNRLEELRYFGFRSRLYYFIQALIAKFRNKFTDQVWKVTLKVRIDYKKIINVELGDEKGGFFADCFVRCNGDDSFILLFERYNPITSKGEIEYRVYRVNECDVELVFSKVILADSRCHYSYPAFIEVEQSAFSFSVESIDSGKLGVYKFDIEGNLLESFSLNGEYIDPYLLQVPESKEWLLFYSMVSKPDELVIQPIRLNNLKLERKGDACRILNTWLARGGGDMSVRMVGDNLMQVTRYVQLSLPVYGSDLVESKISLLRGEAGWKVEGFEVNTAFGSEVTSGIDVKGIHTFSSDENSKFSVLAYDWR